MSNNNNNNLNNHNNHNNISKFHFIVHFHDCSKSDISLIKDFLNDHAIDFSLIDLNKLRNADKRVDTIFSKIIRNHNARKTRLGTSCYFKLLTPILNPNVDKVLYLDTDIIFTQDISSLFHESFGQPFAAIRDKVLQNYSLGFKNFKKFGLNPSSPYLNGGVLFFYTKEWLKKDFTNHILDHSFPVINELEGGGGGFAADQPCINFAANGNWYELHPKWNHPADTFSKDSKIIHFVGNAKPWNTHCHIKYSKLFFHYLSQTPWKTWMKTEFSKKFQSHRTEVFNHLKSKFQIKLGGFKNLLFPSIS